MGQLKHAGPTWGIVATVKAPTLRLLNFAAYHLDLGAHRVYLFLDDPDAGLPECLKAHPKIRIFRCDARHWQKLGQFRPVKHQVRQCRNASWCYDQRAEVKWLAHIDVDEFLWPHHPLRRLLAEVPAEAACARVRPLEALGGSAELYKARLLNGADHDQKMQQLYPRFGSFVPGGLVSHRAGKLFVRTGHPGTEYRIHNVIMQGQANPGEHALEPVDLCHLHLGTWEDWMSTYRFRLQRGSYRAGLAPAKPNGRTLHELLRDLEHTEGLRGLRAFYDEVCADTESHRARLRDLGLLHRRELKLDAKRQEIFPDFNPEDTARAVNQP